MISATPSPNHPVVAEVVTSARQTETPAATSAVFRLDRRSSKPARVFLS
jgi:hypothetical protein